MASADRRDATRTVEGCVRESVTRLAAASAVGFRDCSDLYPEFKAAVEHLSDGRNTVILDDIGMPSMMARIARMDLEPLTGDSGVHPAFLLGGKTIGQVYVSLDQNIVRHGRAYSLPLQDPQSGVVLDEADAFCRAKGPGWGLMPFSLWAALALWCRKNGTLPRGNNFGGRDFFHREETGLAAADGRVAPGSGPASWAHDGRPEGIYDLNGNVNEWQAGLRLQDGQIQILPGADCLLPGADISENSPQWRAIRLDGTLVAPNQAEAGDTLHYAGRDGRIILTAGLPPDGLGTFNCAFTDIRAAEGLAAPVLARALTLIPDALGLDYGPGWRWIKNSGECLPLCGGGNKADDHAGIFFVGMTYPRNHRYGLAGFRTVYVEEAAR
jgi:hypothetical protein